MPAREGTLVAVTANYPAVCIMQRGCLKSALSVLTLFPFLPFSALLCPPPFYALVAEAKCRSRSSRGPREADTWRYTKGNASRRSGLIIRSRGTGRHSGANNASAAHLRLRSRRKDGNRITLIAAEMIKGRKWPLFCHAPRFLPLRLAPQFRFLSVAAFYAASAGDCNPLDRPILSRKLEM